MMKKINPKTISAVIIILGILLSSAYLYKTITENPIVAILAYQIIYILVALIGSIIPWLIYFVIQKIRKEKINFNVLLIIYAITFFILSVAMAPSFYVRRNTNAKNNQTYNK